MNYNQNAKIEQVTEDTIVIGVDIGSESHTPGRLTGEGWSWRKRYIGLAV